MNRALFFSLIFLILSACGNTTGYTGPSADLGPLEIGLHLNTNKEFVLDGKVSIPIIGNKDLGAGLNWDFAFSTVLNQMGDKTNCLVILWQDESGDIREQDYSIGQSFEINFEHDQWVRRIEHTQGGNIVVFVEKQELVALVNPTATEVTNNAGNNSMATEVTNNASYSSAGETFSDPGDFARWYFTAVWKERNYDYLWALCTPSFQSAASTGGYSEFTSWWGSVDKADIGSISVTQNDGHYASIHVVVTFNLHDGRVLKNRQYDYDLVFDSNRQTWMFDYR